MLKLRKRLLAAGLAAVLSVSAASIPVWSDTETATDDTASVEVTGGAEGQAAEEAAAEDGVFVTEADALADMEVMAQKKDLKLWVNKKTGLFAVEDTA